MAVTERKYESVDIRAASDSLHFPLSLALSDWRESIGIRETVAMPLEISHNRACTLMLLEYGKGAVNIFTFHRKAERNLHRNLPRLLYYI